MESNPVDDRLCPACVAVLVQRIDEERRAFERRKYCNAGCYKGPNRAKFINAGPVSIEDRVPYPSMARNLWTKKQMNGAR